MTWDEAQAHYISKLQNVNIEAFLEDMELDKINDDDLNEFLSHFEMNVTKSMNKQAPMWKIVKKSQR